MTAAQEAYMLENGKPDSKHGDILIDNVPIEGYLIAQTKPNVISVRRKAKLLLTWQGMSAPPVKEKPTDIHILCCVENPDGTMTCTERVCTSETAESTCCPEKASVEGGKILRSITLSVAQVKAIEDGKTGVVKGFPQGKIQKARYIGPKTKIARRFKEPIFGPDKVLEK